MLKINNRNDYIKDVITRVFNFTTGNLFNNNMKIRRLSEIIYVRPLTLDYLLCLKLIKRQI